MAGDLLEIEQLARRSPRANPGMAVTVVRPAALVGGPAVDTLVTRHFEAPRLLTVKGCAPRWQFCHVDDLASALEFAVGAAIDGAFEVGSDGWLEQQEVEGISGLRSIELPAGLTFGTAQRLHRLGLTPAPAMDLRYVVYPWVVDCAALREAGWRPRVRQRGGVPGTARPAPGGTPWRAAGSPARRRDHRRGRRGHRRRHRHRGHRPPRPPPPPRLTSVLRRRHPSRYRCPMSVVL